MKRDLTHVEREAIAWVRDVMRDPIMASALIDGMELGTITAKWVGDEYLFYLTETGAAAVESADATKQ